MKSIGALVLFTLVAIANAECRDQMLISGVSRDGKWQVSIKNGGKFALALKNGTEFKIQSRGRLEATGHHQTVFVSNSGKRFVTVDIYAGITIYDTEGYIVTRLAPKDLLSASELENRPETWACHPEGKCITGMKTERGAVVVSLSNGKTVRLEGV